MKRDPSLVREIMLELEAWPVERGDVLRLRPEDFTAKCQGRTIEEIELHLDLIQEVGFIENANASPAMEGFYFRRLTWSGYEWLDAVRSPEVWRKTKDVAAKAGGVSIKLAAELATSIAKSIIREATGMNLG